MQGHPVDFALPAFPVPVGHCVAEGNDVEIVVVFEKRYGFFGGLVGQIRRPYKPFAGPGVDSGTVLAHVFIECTACSHRTAGLDIQSAVGYLGGEDIATVAFVKIYRYVHGQLGAGKTLNYTRSSVLLHAVGAGGQQGRHSQCYNYRVVKFHKQIQVVLQHKVNHSVSSLQILPSGQMEDTR